MITLRCPVCGPQAHVRAKTAKVTCPHAGTRHDAKRAALMTVVQDQLELKETA